MKKLLFILFSLLFIPVVFAKENVSIEKIELVSKDDNVLVNSEPTFSGLEMNYDIAFKKVGDSIKYKVLIKNDTSNDYKISSETSFSKSNYLKYEYEVSDILKANSSIEVLVTITYNKEIVDSEFVNERYDETNKAVVKLLTLDNEEVNPKTTSGAMLILLLVIVFVLYMGLVILVNKKSMLIKIPILIIGGMLIIPIFSKALEELKITVNVKVEVLKTYKVTYSYGYYGYYTKEQIKNIKVPENTTYNCSDDQFYYVGSVSEENKYYNCLFSVVVDDPNRYYAGEDVTVLEFESDRIELEGCRQEDENDICDNIIEVEGRKLSSWGYIKESIDYFNEKYNTNYTYLDNDNIVMNFRNLDPENEYPVKDWWKTGKLIYFYSGNHFTMPKHDVLITPRLPS